MSLVHLQYLYIVSRWYHQGYIKHTSHSLNSLLWIVILFQNIIRECCHSIQAIQQRLEQGKVPCLCALVKAFSLTEADASVLLKDPTGTNDSSHPCICRCLLSPQ